MDKIGLFGGTFNPIHNGHLFIAEQAREKLGLKKVIFIPSYIPPHRNARNLASAKNRFALVSMAVHENRCFQASDIELLRKGHSYAIDTVTAIKKSSAKNTELYFLLGFDSALELHTWHNVDMLLSLCRFVVFERQSNMFTQENLKKWKKVCSNIRNKRGLKKIKFIKLKSFDVSSTEIREKVRTNKSIKYLLPDKVERYIYKHRLWNTAG